MPGKSLIGLPVSKTNEDVWVPANKLKERLSKDVMNVEYKDGKLYFDMSGPGYSLYSTTMTYDDYYGPSTGFLNKLYARRDAEDVVFRTT